MEPVIKFNCLITNRLEDLGRIRELLNLLLEEDFMNDDFFTKHNTYWDSEHEVEADKLDDCRMKFRRIHDQLWDIFGIAAGHDYGNVD